MNSVEQPDKSKKPREILALTVSIILVVGCLSLWISRNNARLAYAQAKPIPTVLRASFAPQDEKQPGDPHERVLILVTTFDKMGVSIKEVKVQPKLLAFGDNDPRKPCFDELDGKRFPDSDPFEVGRDQPSVASPIIWFPRSCSGGGWDFVGEATFKGKDDSGHDYKQSVLFRAKVPTDL